MICSREEEAALGSFLAGKEFGLERPTAIFIVTHFSRHLRPCHVYQVDEEPSQPFDIITKGQQIDTGCRLLHDHEELPTALWVLTASFKVFQGSLTSARRFSSLVMPLD
ncbi:uncharacterized protein LMH87_008527 [Akanthomyces muscarius]|uniref:Uncharacterized protein n=1 Tax=Akanthomyces muscarius TaxID=2231603 RepID=A0A9W8QJV0_AKAMU|nr:uncharacterized protein LMH87_008527 [Akanthomyces muscarius]KAJ4157980.1 hypothetical protein LMH87_008527 [Akanthomyces muscarius]